MFMFSCFFDNYLFPDEIKSKFTWEAKWTHTGLRFQTGVKTSSVHMKFLMKCLHDILSPEKKFHFCQNDRYEIHTRIDFQTHMRINCNIQRVCAYSSLCLFIPFWLNYVHMKT